jgi:hypothetical protein
MTGVKRRRGDGRCVAEERGGEDGKCREEGRWQMLGREAMWSARK